MLSLYACISRMCYEVPPTALPLLALASDLSDPKVTEGPIQVSIDI